MAGKKKSASLSESVSRKAGSPKKAAVEVAASAEMTKAAGPRGRTAVDQAVQDVLHPATAPPRKPTKPEAMAVATVMQAAPAVAAPPLETVPEEATNATASASVPADRPAPVSPPPPARDAPPAGPAPVADMPVPDFEALSRNMAQLVEDSGKLAATYAPRKPPALRADVADAVQTLGQIAEHWFGDPGRLVQAQATLTAQMVELWAGSAARLAAPKGEPAPQTSEPTPDKRFKDPAWRESPLFDFVHKAFLLGSRWATDLVDQTDGLDDLTREKARFYVRQIMSAVSPSNFVPTNPELLRETLRENGGNLLRGLKMLSEDLAAGNGQLRIRHTDTSKFALGVNMALTPGKVVYRNELMELLQYAPSTPQVLERPLLIVPPWINKFYVLDLNPDKSFIRWAVGQGLTVFVISWVNPDERHADKGFEAYMREGVLAALDEIKAVTGQDDVTAIGYCVGGTLVAVTLAHMAAEGDQRITSATLFTAQVDFTHAGDLKVFADEGQIKALEDQMREQGYLRGAQMAQAFNMLRPDDLIWSYWVNNYLRGKEPPAFDLLAWNSDSTRMPAANHSFYLRNCYLENKLARGLMEIGGRVLDMKRVTVPIYNLATREDHIAPALSVFEGCKSFGGPVRYVLSGSGHVAGVVNPPAKAKYGFVAGPEPVGAFEDWLTAAVEHKGSWWPDWFEWIRAQAPTLVPGREPGGGRETLGDAPGSYVRVKA